MQRGIDVGLLSLGVSPMSDCAKKLKALFNIGGRLSVTPRPPKKNHDVYLLFSPDIFNANIFDLIGQNPLMNQLNRDIFNSNLVSYALLFIAFSSALSILLFAEDFVPTRSGTAFTICCNLFIFATGQINGMIISKNNKNDS